MWNVLEQPWTLLGAAVIVLFAVLTFRSVWFEKRRWWQWLLPIGVAASGLGLDYAVTTDLEKVHKIMKVGIEAVEREDCATIARLLADDYEDSCHKSKQALLSRCRSRLVPPAVEKISRFAAQVEVTPPAALATLTLMMQFDKDSFWAKNYKTTAIVTVQIYLQKQPDRNWLIHRTEVLEVDKMPVTWNVAGEIRRRSPDIG